MPCLFNLPYCIDLPGTVPAGVLPLGVAEGLLGALPAVAVTVSAVFLTIGVGALLRRWNVLDVTADETLLKLLVRVFIPALIVSRVLGNEALEDWRNVVYPPVAAFVLVTLGFAAAAGLLVLLRRTGTLPAEFTDVRRRRTFILCVGMFNYGYVTIPLVESLFDTGGTLGVLFIFNVGVEAAMWGVGVTVLAGTFAAGWWKRLFSPPVIATLGALAINLVATSLDLRSSLPSWADMTLETLGRSLGWLAQAAIPIGLLLTGATIYEDWHQCRLRSGKGTIAAASFVRLLLLPAAFVGLALLLPAPVELKRVLVLQAAMPSAVFPIVLSRHYGGDVGTALRIVVGTSLVSIITMPAWVTLGLWLVG